MTTMAEVEAFAPTLQDVTSGPRFASVKIDGANLERVLSSRGRHLHRQPHPRLAGITSRSSGPQNQPAMSRCTAINSLTFGVVSDYSRAHVYPAHDQ